MYIQIERVSHGNSQLFQGSNIIGTLLHPLVSPTQGLCSNPRHQLKGYHLSLELCSCWSPIPTLSGAATSFVGSIVCVSAPLKQKPSDHGIAVSSC